MSKSCRPSRATQIPHQPAHPWVINGTDYGPAVAAVNELAEWAFDLAARDVADWPEGQRRVRFARRFVLDHLSGRRSRRVAIDDVLFCAGLLARIFEADLKLGLSEVITILDVLGLPTEDVPRSATQARQRGSVEPPITPLRPRPATKKATAAAAPCDACDHVCPHSRYAA